MVEGAERITEVRHASSSGKSAASRLRAEASRADAIVMNKPLKPAPLRAELTRYSAMREAAE